MKNAIIYFAISALVLFILYSLIDNLFDPIVIIVGPFLGTIIFHFLLKKYPKKRMREPTQEI